MRLSLMCAALVALGATEARGQAAPPPARLPAASPPVPAPARDTVRTPVVLQAPAVVPPPAAAPRGVAPVTAPAAALVAAPPANATMRCKDGTYLTGAPADDRCRDRGGVAVIFPAPLPPPPAPAPRAP